MATLRLSEFLGEVPRIVPRQLNDRYAQSAFKGERQPDLTLLKV